MARRRIGQGPVYPALRRDFPTRDARDPREFTTVVLPTAMWDTPPDVRVRPRLSPPDFRREAAEGGPAEIPVQFPPWLFPPSTAFAFDAPQNRIPVLIAAAGSLVVTLPRVPMGATGVVQRIGVSTGDAVNTRITTRINAAPVPPWGGIIGALSALEDPTPLPGPILIRGGDEFSVLLENIGGVGILMAARILGWWWS